MRRYLLLALSLLLGPVTSAHAQVSVGVGIAVPGVSIGINMPVYPELTPVPGYPVYYDPRADANYFFYDGMYWVYQGDSWYASSWYNGPWYVVEPVRVPLFVLRVPVRYYRRPPPYFQGWRPDAPPRWGQHWGHDWERRRPGWDRWDRRAVPRRAPLPVYQRQYSGDRYPRDPRQFESIRSQHYRYQPRETVTRQHFQQQGYQDRPRAEPQRQRFQEQEHRGRPPAEQRQRFQEQEHRGGPPAEQRQRSQEQGYRGRPPAEPQQRGPVPQRAAPPQRQQQQPQQRQPERQGGRSRDEEHGPDRR